MGRFVMKAEPDLDFYVEWSTITESPTWWGTRAQAFDYLTCTDDRRHPISNTPAERLDRADKCGTSEMSVREGEWSDGGIVYEQRGILPRTRLVDACIALANDDEPAVWDMLQPFEEQEEVRRG